MPTTQTQARPRPLAPRADRLNRGLRKAVELGLIPESGDERVIAERYREIAAVIAAADGDEGRTDG